MASPNQEFHTPIGTRPLCKPRIQLGESPKLALFAGLLGTAGAPLQDMPPPSSEG